MKALAGAAAIARPGPLKTREHGGFLPVLTHATNCAPRSLEKYLHNKQKAIFNQIYCKFEGPNDGGNVVFQE